MANLYYKIEDLFLQETSILYDRLFLPASFEITDHKAERTEYPVNDHRNPDTEYTHSHIFSKHVTESDSEDPHGYARNVHTCLRITRCTERRRQAERNRPDKYRTDSVEMYDIRRRLCCKIGQVICI